MELGEGGDEVERHEGALVDAGDFDGPCGEFVMGQVDHQARGARRRVATGDGCDGMEGGERVMEEGEIRVNFFSGGHQPAQRTF